MHGLCTYRIVSGTRFRGHEHAYVHVCVVLDGGFAERCGPHWQDAAPGTVRVSAAARHDIDFGPDGARCLVFESPSSTDVPAFERLQRPRFWKADGWLARVVRNIAVAESRTDPAHGVVLEGLATEFLAQLMRRLDGRQSPPPSWLERVHQQVEDLGGVVSVGALAAEAGVHRVHLARTFRDHFGLPVTEYARRLRLAVAQRLLLTSELSLAAVAARAGFADQSHLTRTLRAMIGVTPGAVRRAALHRFKTAGPIVP